MQAHFASLPDSYACPITRLELATQWRRPHVSEMGIYHFLDSMTQYALFVWNVVDLFSTVEKITISHLKPAAFAATLLHVLRVDTMHGSIGSASDSERPAGPLCWKILEPLEHGNSFLMERTSGVLRQVEIECQAAPQVDSFTKWYGSLYILRD
jgi:hypothetical protein